MPYRAFIAIQSFIDLRCVRRRCLPKTIPRPKSQGPYHEQSSRIPYDPKLSIGVIVRAARMHGTATDAEARFRQPLPVGLWRVLRASLWWEGEQQERVCGREAPKISRPRAGRDFAGERFAARRQALAARTHTGELAVSNRV